MTMEMFLGIMGAFLGLLGIVFSALSYHHNKIEAVNAYYENDRDLFYIKARKAVHDMPVDYKPDEIHSLKASDGEPLGSYVAYLVLSYDQAGTLIQKGQLPIWLFGTSSGNAAVQFFEFLKPYIMYRRDEDNRDYGKQFEDLVKTIKKKYPKKEYIYRKQ